MRQIGPAITFPQILLVQGSYPLQMQLQWRSELAWQHGHPILLPLAIADQDFQASKLHILDPQTQHFHQTHTGAIQQTGYQPQGAIQLRQHARHLLPRQHHRQALRTARPNHAVHPWQLDLQDLLIKEENRRQRLVLRGGRNIPAHRQVTQESLDFRASHLLRMAILVEANIALDPLQIDSFGANRIVSKANLLAYLIEQSGLVIHVAIAP